MSLSHSGGDSSTTYNFSYGVAGLSTAVKIGETWTLVSNDYNSGAWTLAQQLYGNGLWWKYDYDAQTDDLLRRYTNLSDSTGTGYAYTYDSCGQIAKIEKKSLTLENGAITGETLLTAEYYGYDAMDRLTRIVVTDGTNLISDIAWSYDADQNVTAITTRVNNNGTLRTDTYAYSYDDDHRPTNTAYGSVSESITYDGYSRVTGKTVQNSGNTVLSTSYAYRDIDAEHTTTQVSSLTSTFGGNTLSHSYTYDANGNILSDGSTTYAYDSLNQLVWEYNTAAGKAWNYAYDLGGNILSKTEYDYADGQTSNPVTVSYTYGDAAWRDLLTAYNGEAITYDGIGNPTNYRGWGMTWQGGRQLSSMQKDGTTLSFSYNDAGLRNEKTVNGSTRRYIWSSSQLMADIGASDAFYFHYSSSGELIGYTYKTADAETECILVKNQQGDVERVISADGTVLASYTYDAWGNVLTAEGILAQQNPIRYRGYYFDTETSLYYLQSRYYDPTVGRFINADGCVTTNLRGLLSANVFAYCENAPTVKEDPSGTHPYFDLNIGDFLTIHTWVQLLVQSENPQMKLEIFVVSNSGRRGRLDLYDPDTNQFYEVKSVDQAANAADQISRYSQSVIHSRMYPQYYGRTPLPGTNGVIIEKEIYNKGHFEYGIYDVTYWQAVDNPTLILYKAEVNKGRQAAVYAATAAVIMLMLFCPPATAAAPFLVP